MWTHAGRARCARRSPRRRTAPPASGPTARADVEWPYYAGNLASQRYSPLDQINRDNVGKLEIAWRFQTGNYGPKPEARNEATPLMIGGVLYTTVGVTRNVIAIDPKSGETLWAYRPNDGEDRYKAAPRKTSGRGLSYWTDHAGNERLFVVTPGFYLVALDPSTGRQAPGFGENGVVDLMVGVRGEVTDKTSIGNSSPSLVIGDVVIVGPAHDVGMRPPAKKNLKGDVRGFDVHSGKLLWTFHTIPAKGENGYETWLDGSAETASNAGVWAPMSADPDLGYVYLPVEGAARATPTADDRPGNNLYRQQPRLPRREDGRGRLVLPADPSRHLGLGQSDGADPDESRRRRQADQGRRADHEAGVRLHVRSHERQAAFGRSRSGPCGKSDVPGEITSPTQPFPTKPPPSIAKASPTTT